MRNSFPSDYRAWYAWYWKLGLQIVVGESCHNARENHNAMARWYVWIRLVRFVWCLCCAIVTVRRLATLFWFAFDASFFALCHFNSVCPTITKAYFKEYSCNHSFVSQNQKNAVNQWMHVNAVTDRKHLRHPSHLETSRLHLPWCFLRLQSSELEPEIGWIRLTMTYQVTMTMMTMVDPMLKKFTDIHSSWSCTKVKSVKGRVISFLHVSPLQACRLASHQGTVSLKSLLTFLDLLASLF